MDNPVEALQEEVSLVEAALISHLQLISRLVKIRARKAVLALGQESALELYLILDLDPEPARTQDQVAVV